MAPGVGKLHLSLGETRSELTMVPNGSTVRKHLLSCCDRQTKAHRELLCAVVRLACSSKIDVAGVKAVFDSKLAELQT
jgi:hypothetical protein